MPTSFKKIFIKFHYLASALAVFIILFIAVKYFLIPYYNQTVTQTQNQSEDYQKELEKRQDYLKNLKALKADYDSIDLAKRIKINQIIPASSQIPELLLALNAIAGESGFILSSISVSEQETQENDLTASASPPDSGAAISEPAGEAPVSNQPKKDSNLKTLELNLNLTGGNYEKLKLFLSKIERNTRLLEVQSINFENSFESVVILLRTYYYPES